MKISYIFEIAALAVLLLTSGTLKLVTRRKMRKIDGSMGLMKKKDAKGGKIIARD